MKKTKLAIAIAAASLISAPAYATNGMNMEGYGPISAGMGGTAQAYNNGLGGMMNNPATMGMGAEEGNKFQIGLGNLRPDVEAGIPDFGIKQASDGDSYFMPGFGYARKRDGVTWGIGILGQGGMGTEYPSATSQSDLFAGGFGWDFTANGGMGGPMDSDGDPQNGSTPYPMLPGDNRSELSVGRVLLPINMEVNEKLTIGGSVDFVWAGLDMIMSMSGAQLAGMIGQDLVDIQMPAFAGATQLTSARIGFTDDSDYTGEAKSTGLGGKLGMTYKVSDQLTFGASYHTKTNLSDMTGDAFMQMDVNGDGVADGGTMTGQIRVKDFQWPETFGLGMAYKPNDQWLVTADYKRINWSETMENFSMTFTADPAFGGGTMDMTLPQNWDDQDVFMLGAAYKMNKQLTLRAGLNVANNPIPEEMTNPLFPATIENHYTAGFGYNFDDAQSIDFSLTHAPEITVTAPQQTPNGVFDMEISHSQTNWQLMYTYKWGITPK